MFELKMYSNGEWIGSEKKDKSKVINPATKEVMSIAPQAIKKETEDIITIVKQTFESGVWSEISPQDRARYLFNIADRMAEKQEELAVIESSNNGKTKLEAEYDVADAISCFRYYAGLIMKADGESYDSPDLMQGLIVKETVGVAGL